MKLPLLRRIDYMDIDGQVRAESDGYVEVSSSYTYKKVIKRSVLDFRVERAFDYQLQAVQTVALQELRSSRLYQDARCSFFVAQQVYRDRVKKAFDNDVVFVALHYDYDDRVIGFASVRENEVDMIAVLQNYQGYGVGACLMKFCEDHCSNEGFDEIIVRSHGRNSGARHFYNTCGFHLDKMEKEFHCHLGQSGVMNQDELDELGWC